MSHILDTSCPTYTILRGNCYYLNLGVPKAQQQLHGQIIRSKLANDRDQAEALAGHVVGILKKAWTTNNSSKIDIEKLIASARPRTCLMSEFADEYVSIRQFDPNPIHVALRSLFEVVGDRDDRSYTREDARRNPSLVRMHSWCSPVF